MSEMKIALFFPLFFSAMKMNAQDALSGLWKLPDGSCTYELRLFEDGQFEARVKSSTKPTEKEGRIVLDHIGTERNGHVTRAVIHSAGVDVPREVIISLKNEGRTLDLEIPRPFSPVHITWHRVGDAHVPGQGGSVLSLNE